MGSGAPRAQQATAGLEGVYTIPHFTFESGEAMDAMKAGYVTFSQLNADGSNAVLLVPGPSPLRHWADDYVGPSKMDDTDRSSFILPQRERSADDSFTTQRPEC